MNQEYWLWDGQNTSGPHTLTQLSESVRTGHLDLDTQVQVVGGHDWQTLRSQLPKTPPPLPASQQAAPAHQGPLSHGAPAASIAASENIPSNNNPKQESVLFCPRWCNAVMWIGGILWVSVVAINWLVSAQYDAYQAAQDSFGGLGGLWRTVTGEADHDYSQMVALQSLGSSIWRCGALILGAGFVRWIYWTVFQRPQFVRLETSLVEGCGFLFQPPVGWTVEVPIGNPLCIPICFGLPIEGFRANVMFSLDSGKDSLARCLARLKAQTAQTVSHWTDISSEPFTTNDGHTGIRLISQGSAHHLKARWNIYVFQRSDGYKLQLIFTTLQSQGSLMDAVYDQCVANMAVDKAPVQISPNGDLAMEGPAGWSVEMADNCPAFLGPTIGNVQSRIQIVILTPAPTNETLENTISRIRKECHELGYEELSLNPFVTQSGKKGCRVCIHYKDDLSDRYGISYFFEGKIGKFALFCEFNSAMTNGFDLCDACVTRLKFI